MVRLSSAVTVGTGQHIVEPLAKARVLALGVEHQVLDETMRLLEEPTSRPTLAGTTGALKEETGLDELVQVDGDLGAGGGAT